ncbi:Dihydropteroate synthase [Tistlia consotensis]|uniref:Dihydropteroate synthase n=1 Tax=Tistlia consotensis USBA 355 TaxID=560819 RepID=A0A1Y6C221_9PROT|nr:dihydropteroate synthase [Tistlia consotensis]SMF32622.1 Dihydropteroate synthase [Tistlia consotensis USBA 355]SNR68720.1 Dihydropteroate synthase [Tistlia consotensis]
MTARFYLEPLEPTPRRLPGGRALAGQALHFARVELGRWDGGSPERQPCALAELPEAAQPQLEPLSAPRPPFAGVAMDRPSVMGIVNVTPDSFSDGGDRFDPEVAIGSGLAMWRAGAAFVDVGGESTRPGAKPVTVAEEIARIRPVVAALAEAGVRVSIDTRHAAVMAAAAEAGAAVINDVTALTHDPEALAVAAGSGLPVILMHMLGTPATMQQDPRYADVAFEVFDHLAARLEACTAAGIPRERLCVDPGIGFGKTVAHNCTLIARLSLFHGLGCPVLLGASRKAFIGRLSAGEPPKGRLPGSLAVALAGAARGAQILRVHDVPETLQALALQRALDEAAAH